MRAPAFGLISNADIDSLEEVIVISTKEFERLWITFVVGAANLSAFSVDFRVHPAGDWVAIANVAADFTTPEGPVLGASGDLTTAAFGATVHFVSLDVQAVESVRLRAAGTSSTIAGHFCTM
jgi:hypothetical protein